MPLLAQELGGPHPEIRSQIGGYFAAWMGYLDDLLAGAAREAGSDLDLTALKEFIVATTEGIPVVRGQFGDQSVANVTRELVASIIDRLTS